MRYISKLWSVKWLLIFIIPAIALLFSPVRAEPFVWFLFCIIAAIALSIILRQRIALTSGRYVLLTLGVIVVIILLFANDQHRPSRVDVSPLAELSAEQIERVESVIMQLEGIAAVRSFSVSDHQTRRSYSFGWFVPDWHREVLRVNVSICTLTDEQRAMEDIESSRRQIAA